MKKAFLLREADNEQDIIGVIQVSNDRELKEKIEIACNEHFDSDFPILIKYDDRLTIDEITGSYRDIEFIISVCEDGIWWFNRTIVIAVTWVY